MTYLRRAAVPELHAPAMWRVPRGLAQEPGAEDGSAASRPAQPWEQVPRWSMAATPCDQVPGGVEVIAYAAGGKWPRNLPEGCVETGEASESRKVYCCPKAEWAISRTAEELRARQVATMPAHLQSAGAPVGTILLGLGAAAVIGWLVWQRVRGR